MAAHHMPTNSMDEMEAKLQPVIQSVLKTNFLLKETQENYVREKLRSTVLMKANDYLRTKATVIASK